MPNPVFPTTLPNVLMGSYSYKPGNNLLRTEMESGYARVRRRFISVPTDVRVTWSFTREQLGVFEAFYRNTIDDGAAWFDIKLVNGASENTVTARFKEQYDVATDKREFHWRVTATLEVLSMPLTT